AVSCVSRALDLPVDASFPEHVQNTIKNKQTLLISPPFSRSVLQAVQTVRKALSNLAKAFARTSPSGDGEAVPNLEHNLFADVEEVIELLIQDQNEYETWTKGEGFATWLTNGDVLAVSPGAHVWAKLLQDNREAIRSAEPPAFMISQLATLL